MQGLDINTFRNIYYTFVHCKNARHKLIFVHIPPTSSQFSNFPGLVCVDQLSTSTMMPKQRAWKFCSSTSHSSYGILYTCIMRCEIIRISLMITSRCQFVVDIRSRWKCRTKLARIWRTIEVVHWGIRMRWEIWHSEDWHYAYTRGQAY